MKFHKLHESESPKTAKFKSVFTLKGFPLCGTRAFYIHAHFPLQCGLQSLDGCLNPAIAPKVENWLASASKGG